MCPEPARAYWKEHQMSPLQTVPSCTGTVHSRTRGDVPCERVGGHPGEHYALRARVMLDFDPIYQRMHLANCTCTDRSADLDVVGALDDADLTRDKIQGLLESEGGPSTCQIASCLTALIATANAAS